MPNPVKERIVKLREEIAQISEANQLYLRSGKKKLHGLSPIFGEPFATPFWLDLDSPPGYTF
jgi:hypothetical protein